MDGISCGGVYVRTPIGKVSWISIVVVLALLGAVVAGLIVPGRTGEIIEVVAWFAVAVVVALEIGLRMLPIGDHDGNDRRPW
ncbi:MAG TPA: hypothetical protein VEB65_00835 [Solirubrobacterales bacterium]|nr:hypothetical protein [Solirubrobacterales bacterium]